MAVITTILMAYKTSKYGSKASNCADSFAISPNGLKIAIADGVSKSYMPKFVADALTEYYVSDKYTGGTLFNDYSATELLSNVVEVWSRKTHDFEAAVDEDTAFDLEYQRELYGMGASTFAGICIGQDAFTFSVLGDSCIFLIPKDKGVSPVLLASMPCDVNIESDTPFKCDFGTHPHFIDTKGRIVGDPFEDSMKAIDCTIILATDAFSDWFCRNYTKEDSNHIIDSLKEIDSQERFDSFIDNLRDKDLKNDDVAIVLVDVRLINNEYDLLSEANGETELTTPECDDDEPTLEPTDEIEANVEDSEILDAITTPEDNQNTYNSNDIRNSDSDESEPTVKQNDSEEIAPEKLPNSEILDNMEDPKSEAADTNIIVDEEIVIDNGKEMINRESNIISRIRKCLGLN